MDESIPTPQLVGNFFRFPNTTLSNLNISDCNDTTVGKCLYDKTLNECIDMCDKDDMCSVGYYIKTPDQNICVPLRTSLPNQTFYFNRLREQNFYKELDNTDSMVFVKKRTPEFPPNRSNIVFFQDRLMLKNTRNNLIMNTINLNEIKFQDRKDDIQILPPNITLYDNTLNYIPIIDDSDIVISLIGSSLVLRGEEDTLKWVKSSNILRERGNLFHIKAITSSTNPYTALYYGQPFYLTYDGKLLVYDDVDGRPNLEDITYDDAKKANLNIEFVFVPDLNVYYVDENGKCQSIPLAKTQTDGIVSTYNGHVTYRRDTCWIYNPVSTSSKVFFVLILIFLLVLINVIVSTSIHGQH